MLNINTFLRSPSNAPSPKKGIPKMTSYVFNRIMSKSIKLKTGYLKKRTISVSADFNNLWHMSLHAHCKIKVSGNPFHSFLYITLLLRMFQIRFAKEWNTLNVNTAAQLAIKMGVIYGQMDQRIIMMHVLSF